MVSPGDKGLLRPVGTERVFVPARRPVVGEKCIGYPILGGGRYWIPLDQAAPGDRYLLEPTASGRIAVPLCLPPPPVGGSFLPNIAWFETHDNWRPQCTHGNVGYEEDAGWGPLVQVADADWWDEDGDDGVSYSAYPWYTWSVAPDNLFFFSAGAGAYCRNVKQIYLDEEAPTGTIGTFGTAVVKIAGDRTYIPGAGSNRVLILSRAGTGSALSLVPVPANPLGAWGGAVQYVTGLPATIDKFDFAGNLCCYQTAPGTSDNRIQIAQVQPWQILYTSAAQGGGVYSYPHTDGTSVVWDISSTSVARWSAATGMYWLNTGAMPDINQGVAVYRVIEGGQRVLYKHPIGQTPFPLWSVPTSMGLIDPSIWGDTVAWGQYDPGYGLYRMWFTRGTEIAEQRPMDLHRLFIYAEHGGDIYCYGDNVGNHGADPGAGFTWTVQTPTHYVGEWHTGDGYRCSVELTDQGDGSVLIAAAIVGTAWPRYFPTMLRCRISWQSRGEPYYYTAGSLNTSTLYPQSTSNYGLL